MSSSSAFSSRRLGLARRRKLRVPRRPGRAVTFAKDVAPILYCQLHLVSSRRRSRADGAAAAYDEVRPWARAIKQKVLSRQMPPWFADPAPRHVRERCAADRSADRHDRKWVDAGAPRGNPADEPKPPTLHRRLAARRARLRHHLADGEHPRRRQRHFSDAEPDDRHSRGSLDPRARDPSEQSRGDASLGAVHGRVRLGGGMVGSRASSTCSAYGRWARRQRSYPEGVGRWVRKGQQLRTNLHYHPNGKGADRSRPASASTSAAAS